MERSWRRRFRGLAAGLGVGALLLVWVAASTAATPPSEAVYRKLCRSIQSQHVRALFTPARARADPPRRIERLRVLAERWQRARRRRPGVPPDRRRRPDAVEAPRRPSLRHVPHAHRSRAASEVGLPGRTRAVGRRRPHGHVHLHAHSWRRRHEVRARTAGRRSRPRGRSRSTCCGCARTCSPRIAER